MGGDRDVPPALDRHAWYWSLPGNIWTADQDAAIAHGAAWCGAHGTICTSSRQQPAGRKCTGTLCAGGSRAKVGRSPAARGGAGRQQWIQSGKEARRIQSGKEVRWRTTRRMGPWKQRPHSAAVLEAARTWRVLRRSAWRWSTPLLPAKSRVIRALSSPALPV
jgi:hypothetical protein